MKHDSRDSINLATLPIPKLYLSYFFPTLVGMIAAILNTIIDGIFVGHGIGSDAIASVNIIAPLFMLVTGFSLMFGVGSSVVASVHLSQKKQKAARINITQAYVAASIVMIIFSIFLALNSFNVPKWMGSTEQLLPYTQQYLIYLTPGFIFALFSNIGLFIIRLDGSPKFAMMGTLIPSVVNIILDYLFIFIFKWGIKGASIATTVGFMVGGIMVLVYMIFFTKTLNFYPVKLTIKSMRLTARNLGYQIKVGSSAMFGELAISIMIISGNFVFMKMLGEHGVAAFSVACYCYPIAFMINSAVAVSGQPIISYNYGLNQSKRVFTALKMMLITGLICGCITTLAMNLWAPQVAAMFLEKNSQAFVYATKGLPLFALGFIFFAVNMAMIGFYQSTEKVKWANTFSLLRGFILPLLFVFILPAKFGEKGLWLYMPAADIATTIAIIGTTQAAHIKSFFLKLTSNPT